MYHFVPKIILCNVLDLASLATWMPIIYCWASPMLLLMCNRNSLVFSRPYASSKVKTGRREILAKLNLVHPSLKDGRGYYTTCLHWVRERTVASQVQPLWNADFLNNLTSTSVMEVTFEPLDSPTIGTVTKQVTAPRMLYKCSPMTE